MKKILVLLVSATMATAAMSAGFGLYEASARGNVLGGALVGSTGDSDGCHLHLEFMRDGKNADPSPLIGNRYK